MSPHALQYFVAPDAMSPRPRRTAQITAHAGAISAGARSTRAIGRRRPR